MSGLANKVALVIGVRVASARRSPSVWPQMERPWPYAQLNAVPKGDRNSGGRH